jgi:dTMP kinase
MSGFFIVLEGPEGAGQVIRPALEAGRIVVSDRYDLSTLAYQSVGRGLPLPMVSWVNQAATGGLKPDLTLILDLPVEMGAARQIAAGKARDRLDREPEEFHRRVAARYREETGPGVVHLDATQPAAELERAAWNAITSANAMLTPAGAS